MIRTIAYAAAAIVLTTGTVAAMADSGTQPTVRIDKTSGDYCLTSDAIIGTRIASTECHSVADWSKQGVSFSRR